MSRFLYAAALAALVAALAPNARGVITVQGTELPQFSQVSNQLAMSHGVVFSSNMPFVTFDIDGVNTMGIYGTEPWAQAQYGYGWYASPITMTFVDMSDGISPAVVNGTINAVFGDGGGDMDGIRLRAFDVNNNLLATTFGLSQGFAPISITANGIRYITFDQSGLGDPTSDTFLDWVSYDAPVPVPAPGAAAVGLISLCALRRRR